MNEPNDDDLREARQLVGEYLAGRDPGELTPLELGKELRSLSREAEDEDDRHYAAVLLQRFPVPPKRVVLHNCTVRE